MLGYSIGFRSRHYANARRIVVSHDRVLALGTNRVFVYSLAENFRCRAVAYAGTSTRTCVCVYICVCVAGTLGIYWVFKVSLINDTAKVHVVAGLDRPRTHG